MERWETLVEGCPTLPEIRYYSKAIQSASVVLKEDLAPFEIEWILQTLLYEPINLLSIVSTKRTDDDAWFKLIGDSFKLLSEVIDRFPEDVERHLDDIVNICLLKYDAQTRKQALTCLTHVTKISPAGAKDVRRHIADLETMSTGRAPLAILIGSICEQHPQTVENEINKIWRIYLNQLDSNKNTDKIKSSLLEGILGIFKHFGCDLPTAELNLFYDKLTDFMRIGACEEVCLRILADHATLFRERISQDVRIRNFIWNTLHNSTGTSLSGIRAAKSIYEASCSCLNKELIQKIATTEIIPQTQSRTQVKYTAIGILTYIQTNCGVNIEIDRQTDMQLEFELRHQNVSYEDAEAISWCIESNLQNSVNLLQTAILFYDNLPASRRKNIVVHGILNAESNLRSAAITFLISESTHDATSIEAHLKLWKDLFDTDSGKDTTVMYKCRYVFEDFMSYVVFVLDGVLEEGIEKLSEKLSSLLQLTSYVLTFQATEDFTNDYCVVVLPLLIEILKLQPDAVTMAAARNACLHIIDPAENMDLLNELYQLIRIDRCQDEALLCESCLSLILIPFDTAQFTNIFMGLQIVFSRNDVEPHMLVKALRKLEDLIISEKDKLDVRIVNETINQIEKLHNRKDLTGKYSRILSRDVLMFLGKYGYKADVNNNSVENTAIVKLMDSLTLNIPNTAEENNYKLNLRRILQLALENEDPQSLQMLLIIICANLSTKPDSNMQLVLTRVCHALSSTHSRGAEIDKNALQAAILMCDNVACVQGLIQHIGEEKSPGVRRMLSDALEAVLLRDLEGKMISAVADYVTVLMKSGKSTTIRAGLNITETLITSLKNNNASIKDLLPNLLILITKTYETDSEVTFEVGTKLFFEKIELFDQEEVKHLTKKVLEVLLKKDNQNGGNKMADMAEIEIQIFKNTTKMILNFIKDCKKENEEIINVFYEVFDVNCDFEKVLYFLGKMQEIFDFDTDLCRILLTRQDTILNNLFSLQINIEEPYFSVEAVMKFFERFREIMLELKYQETLTYLRDLVTNLTPHCIKYLHRNIETCLTVFTKTRTPNLLQKSFEDWCSKVPIQDITESIEKQQFTKEHSIMIFSLKIMLKIFNTATLPDLAHFAQKWAKTLLKLFSNDYITNYLKSKMSYLTDILTISVKFSKVSDVKKLILEGSEIDGLPSAKIGVQFCQYFMHVFHVILMKKPYMLLDEGMDKCCLLLKDVVKFALKKKCTDEQYGNILELVNELWPIYEYNTTFSQKHSILLDLNSFPKKLSPESNPIQWAVNSLVSSDVSRENKARMIGVLPGGDCYSQAYRCFASTLPTRLSEARGETNACLRALLDALAGTRDLVLLDIVMTLASGDDTKGWWDEAIDSCMASIAARGDLALCKAVYTRCKDGLALGVCRRVLLPLLRYSSSSFNEQFFSSTLNSLLKVKAQKVVAVNHAYRQSILHYTTTLEILQVAFEKVPPSSLESPGSILYQETEKPISLWHIVRTTCALCFSLRKVALPAGAGDKFIEEFRQFQCANYKCFAAAICRRRPGEDKYAFIFDAKVWDTLVDHNKEYKLWIRHQWNQRTKRAAVSIDVENRSGSTTSLTKTTGTVRSRMFLRTLTENPLMYDLLEDNYEEEVETQDIELPSSELNEHECASTLTALLCHVSALEHTTWLHATNVALTDGARNTKWLIASAICNCTDELKRHANALRPGLLNVVATTPIDRDGKKVLNGLHVQILETLIQWGEDSPTNYKHLETCIQLLISTTLEHRQHTTLFRTLLDVLGKILDLYSDCVNVSMEVFEPYLADAEVSKTFQTIQRVVKTKVDIQSLLPTLLNKLEAGQGRQLPNELVGLALNTCKARDKQLYVTRFRKFLEQQRKTNSAEYIKKLYYGQSGCPEVCDEYNFRMTMDLTPKGTEKAKCLKILSTFISTSHSSYIQDLFDTIDFAELLLEESVEAFNLVQAGVKVMQEGVKKRLVMLAAKFCEHSVVKIRKAACEVILAAFEDIFTQPEEPSAKKFKTSTTRIISKILSKDIYCTTILNALSMAAVDKDGDISKTVREGVAKIMSKDMGIRFAESFLLTIYLPSISNNKNNLSVCLSAFLEIFLSDLRSQERFKNIKLKEDPLETRAMGAIPSKLLTMSRTYQGTFRRRTNLTSRRKYTQQDLNLNTPDINVQIPVAQILDTFVEFSKDVPSACQELSILFIQAVRPKFDLGAEIAQSLAAILDNGVNELTPFVIDLCRVFIDDVCKLTGFQNIVEKLNKKTKNTEGEHITKLLLQEVNLRIKSNDQFVLGSPDDEADDVEMDEDLEFCIEDLTSAFGKLANWDNLTLQQKRRVEKSGLPPLWTTQEMFAQQLEAFDYKASTGWFSKMAAAYKQQCKQDVIKWMRDMDRWPRRQFDVSAITEAIEWQKRRDESLSLSRTCSCDIQRSDCLAEWAARFMIRTAYITSLSNPDTQEAVSLRNNELMWCERANEISLGGLVLDCVKRNTPDLYQGEVLPWLRQRVWALRNIGLQTNNQEILNKALTTAEKCTPKCMQYSKPDDIIGMNQLMIILNQDLHSLSKPKIEEIIATIHRQTTGEKVDTKSKHNINSICGIAMLYYDDLWCDEIDAEANQDILSDMLDILAQSVNLGSFDEGLLSMVLNKLDNVQETKMRVDVAKKLLDLVKSNLSSLDDFSLHQLTSHSNILPSRLLSSHPYLNATEDVTVEKYKKCFQLICDAEYILLQYCSMLRKALKNGDEDEWDVVFKRIKEKLFENPYSGSDYQLLNRYKNKLYEISEYDMSPTFKMAAEKTLKEIGRILTQRAPQNVLRLSQLCPGLSRCDDCPGKLLGLRDGVTVVRIDEQVLVFNSIRRPALFKVLLSDGTTRRYLHKSGEPLKVDAAAQKVLRYAGQLWGEIGCPVVGYNVIPLSDDCGLIEFLEEHDTLRSMVGGSAVLEVALDSVPRPADHELILSAPQANLNIHQQLCEKIPSYLLRNSVIKRTVSERDRMTKMRLFQESLSTATILTWVLGVGDRHLENILYSIQDGRLCHIDWGAVLQYGSSEVPAARLTRNLLAVCDAQELEARLQQLLTVLRESSKLFAAVIKISFKWMQGEFNEKFPYIQSLLDGSTLSYNITRQVLETMEEPNKAKHIELLDNVFENFESKDQYSVDEQYRPHCMEGLTARQCGGPQNKDLLRLLFGQNIKSAVCCAPKKIFRRLIETVSADRRFPASYVTALIRKS